MIEQGRLVIDTATCRQHYSPLVAGIVGAAHALAAYQGMGEGRDVRGRVAEDDTG